MGGAPSMPAAFAQLSRDDEALSRILPQQPASEEATDPPDMLPSCPPLPATVLLDHDLAQTGSSWLNEYMAYAQAKSPLTPTLFHESAGLVLISAIIARRLVLPMSFGDIYPNLYVMWIAPSTVYAKSTALNIASDLLLESFPHLLSPQDSTPEALISDMSGQMPKNIANNTADELTKKLWE
jgi:hypothetical protein